MKRRLDHITFRELAVWVFIAYGVYALVIGLLLDALPEIALAMLVNAGIAVVLTRRAERHSPTVSLTASLAKMEWRLDQLNDQWRGTQVRLTHPIRSREGRVLLPAGMVGTIIEVQRDPAQPFVVQFDDVSIPVVPYLHRLAILQDDGWLFRLPAVSRHWRRLLGSGQRTGKSKVKRGADWL